MRDIGLGLGLWDRGLGLFMGLGLAWFGFGLGWVRVWVLVWIWVSGVRVRVWVPWDISFGLRSSIKPRTIQITTNVIGSPIPGWCEARFQAIYQIRLHTQRNVHTDRN